MIMKVEISIIVSYCYLSNFEKMVPECLNVRWVNNKTIRK